MIGISPRSSAIRFCRSSPLSPGRDTSRTRQFGTKARGRARNSCADENVSVCQPSYRISNSSDSRTEMSSSTTKTIGAGSAIRANPLFDIRVVPYYLTISPASSRSGSARKRNQRSWPQRRLESVEEGRIAERLVEAFDCALLKYTAAQGVVSIGCDEDDRNVVAADLQLPSQFGPRHAGHHHIENQTFGLADD